MKRNILILIPAALSIFTGCAIQSKNKGKEIAMSKLMATADTTKQIGIAKFYQLADGKIKMDLEINYALRADSNVAVHFHEKGMCGDMGKAAMGHWNPTNEAHGKWGSSAYHSGDIGNIMLDSKGHGTISLTTDRWSVKGGEMNDIIGRGIIVHGGTDDYTSQPAGNSGPRVGCGEIEAVK